MTGASEDILVPSCIRSRIESMDGELIEVPRVEFVLPGQTGRAVLINLVSKKLMAEPAIKVTVTMVCGTTLQREYDLLLDYAESPLAAPLIREVTPAAPQTGAADLAQPVSNSHRRATQAAAEYTANPDAIHTRARDVDRAAATKKSSRKSGHKEAAGRDVLKVDNESSTAEPDLRLSSTLSEPTPQNLEQLRTEENRLAQARYAAVLRGEDPLAAAQNDIRAEELKIKNLQTELDRIKQQNTVRESKEIHGSPLLTGLIVSVTALVLALIALVALAIRRSRQNNTSTWWDTTAEQKKNVVDIVDYLQTSAEKGNLDPGPITATRSTEAAEAIVPEKPADAPVRKVVSATQVRRSGLPLLEDTNSSSFNFFSNRGQSIQIEEISDITQEAEFWMSVNDPHRAIEILEPQSRDENPTTPVTWLYLLDLYRLVGDEENYTDLRQRFKHKFNAKVPNYQEEVVQQNVRYFEDFPHLVANCCAFWQTDEIVSYLESLLIDDREGERIGFDLPVYRDILFLLSICGEIKRQKSVLSKPPAILDDTPGGSSPATT